MSIQHRDITAPWQVAQHATFVKWVNFILSKCEPPREPIEKLITGLKDGTNLSALIKNLSEGKFKAKTIQKPKMKLMMVSNLNLCLDFLKEEGIAMINVGAVDLYDENYTIVMGLIWNLILFYQINLAESNFNKEALLEWLTNRMSHPVPVKDFSKSWADGAAFSSLAESLHPDHKFLLEENKSPEERVASALSFMEKTLGVPAILEAKSVVEFHDEKSILTYLSLLYKEHKDDPILGCSCPKQEKILCVMDSQAEIDNVTVDCDASLSLHLVSEKADGDRSAFKPTGEVTATLVAPDGTPVPMTLKVGADGQFTADFNSPFIGDHTLKVFHDGNLIQTSVINVQSPLFKLTGPGTDFGLVFAQSPFETAAFHLAGEKELTLEANDERLIIGVTHSSSHPKSETNIPGGSNVANVQYEGEVAGTHTIEVRWKKHLAKSLDVPVYELDLASLSSTSAAALDSASHGKGEEGDHQDESSARFDGLADGVVDIESLFRLKMAGPNVKPNDEHIRKILGDMEICMEDMDGKPVASSGSDGKVNSDNSLNWRHTPEKAGKYRLAIKHKGRVVRDVPFEVDDLYLDIDGAGIGSGHVNHPSKFTAAFMDRPGGTIVPAGDTFEAIVTSPDGKQVPTKITQKEDGSCEVEYTPTVEGVHQVVLKRKGEVVHEAKVPVTDVDFSVNLAGDGLEAAVVGICSNFDVTLQNSAGKTIKKDDLKVVIKDEAGQPIDTSMSDKGDSSNVSFTPLTPGLHTVEIMVGDKLISTRQVPVYEFKLDSLVTGKDGKAMGTFAVKGYFNTHAKGPDAHPDALPRGLEVKFKGPSGSVVCTEVKSYNRVEKGAEHHHHKKGHHGEKKHHHHGEKKHHKHHEKKHHEKHEEASSEADGVQFSYVPHESGPHSVDIMLGDILLYSEPVTVNDLGVEFIKPIPKKGLQVDQSVTVSFSFIDAATKKRVVPVKSTVRLKNAQDQAVEFKKKQKHHDQTDISFIPRRIGEFKLNILATKKRIKKTAFMVRRYCFAFDDENSGGTCLGMPVSVRVFIVDEDENLIPLEDPDEFDVVIKNGEGEHLEFKRDEKKDELIFTATPKAVGKYALELKHGDLNVAPFEFECRQPWFELKNGASEDFQINTEGCIAVYQLHPFSKNPLPPVYWLSYKLDLLEHGEGGAMVSLPLKEGKVDPSSDKPSQLFHFTPNFKGSHLGDIQVDGTSVDQPNLPFNFEVSGLKYDSYVKMYFSNEDIYRRIGIADTFVTVGCNRDTTMDGMKENVFLKLKTRIPPEDVDAFKKELSKFSALEIPMPKTSKVSGNVEATVARDPKTVKITVHKGKDLVLFGEDDQIIPELLDPVVVCSFCDFSYKTKVKKNSETPEFGETFFFDLLDGKVPVHESGGLEKLRVSLWDWERSGNHQFLGGLEIDVPRKETNGECQWYPVRRFREEKNIKPYRMAGFTGGGPSRKTSFGSFSGSFSKQKKVEKSAGQQSVLLKNDMKIWDWSAKGMQEAGVDASKNQKVIAFQLHISSYTFDVMYPMNGSSNKEVMIPMICKDPKNKNAKVDDHQGSLVVRIECPDKKILLLDVVKTPNKVGAFHCSFVPEFPGTYLAWTVFNDSMVHAVPASLKIRGKGGKEKIMSPEVELGILRASDTCIEVEVRNGRNLPAMDVGGTSDPFAKVEIGDKQFTTPTVKKTLTPVFNSKFVFEGLPKTASHLLKVTLFDEDIGSSEFMGELEVEVTKEKYEKVSIEWYPLKKTRLESKIKKRDEKDKKKDEKEKKKDEKRKKKGQPQVELRVHFKSNKVVEIDVLRGRDLPAMDRGGTSDPQCFLTIGNAKKKTPIIKKTLEPVFHKSSFVYDELADVPTHTLRLMMYDDDGLAGADFMGHLDLEITKEAFGSETTAWYDLDPKKPTKTLAGPDFEIPKKSKKKK